MDLSTVIDSAPLASGEIVALGVVEVTAVPHFSVADEGAASAEEVIGESTRAVVALLNEVFQTWRISVIEGSHPECAIGLLYVTHEVTDQAYRAGIRMFVTVRALDDDAARAVRTARFLLSSAADFLSDRRYDCRPCPPEDLAEALGALRGESVVAITKEGRVENLQNPIVPYCYTTDHWEESTDDLSRVIDCLSERPGCALSVQLVPVALSVEEASAIDQTAQSLEALSRGIASQEVGNIAYALAVSPAETYRRLASRKTSPLFSYAVLAMGGSDDVETLAGRMVGRLASGPNASASLATWQMGTGEVDWRRNLYPLPWAVLDALAGRLARTVRTPLSRLPLVLLPEEAAELFRLPVGDARVAAGLVVNESSRRSKTYTPGVVNGGDLELGRLASSSAGNAIGVKLSDFAKHLLVVGTPGSGKTTFLVGLLDRLWREHGVPFLVIEPAKNEYRAMLRTIPELQVFTPGKSYISPFVMNPFLPPSGVRLETYKSTLKTAFSAGVSMTTPLDRVFEEALASCYSDFHWLDTSVAGDGGETFNIQDFIACFRRTFDEIGYTGDAINIGRAGEVRLRGVARLFDTYRSIPVENLLNRPTVIELAAVENSDEKALVIALVLLQILAYVNANYLGAGGLRNLILLEEAHVLLDSGATQGDAQPGLVAQGLLKRMLAEIRSYGVGIAVADQSPRKVGSDVMALTDIKMAFRLVEGEDRRILADSVGMSDAQTQRLGRLRPGQAMAFFSRLDEPEELIVPDHRSERSIDVTISDAELARLSTYWSSHPLELRPYPECELCSCCTEGCSYERRVLARDVARRVFVQNLRRTDRTLEPLRALLARISRAVGQELDGRELTPELLLCVKVHLWRRVRYDTLIPITPAQVEHSLRRQ